MSNVSIDVNIDGVDQTVEINELLEGVASARRESPNLFGPIGSCQNEASERSPSPTFAH